MASDEALDPAIALSLVRLLIVSPHVFPFVFLQAGVRTSLRDRASKHQKGGKKRGAGETAFPTGFEHIDEQREQMRSEVQKFKDIEFAATQAQADVERLQAVVKSRQDIVDMHREAQFKLHSNLHTMFGASNGIFDRLPRSSTMGRRGSPAQRSWGPARRIVPARLARLEDQRMLARRRTYTRGDIGKLYHGQLHGKDLGVAGPVKDYAAADSFLQVNEDGVVHDAVPLRELPTEY